MMCGYGGHLVNFPVDKGQALNIVAFRTKQYSAHRVRFSLLLHLSVSAMSVYHGGRCVMLAWLENGSV
jgi:hypothetical protein